MSKFSITAMSERLVLSDIGRKAKNMPTENMDLGWAISHLKEAREVLEELAEHLNDYADAEYVTDRAAPVGNAEMALLARVRGILEKLK